MDQNEWSRRLSPVVADGLDRTAFHGFLALRFFFGSDRLLINVGIPAVIATGEVVRGGFAATWKIMAIPKTR